MKSADRKAAWFSESLARGLQVICAFDAKAPALRPIDVAKRTGLSRAAARRYLLTLESLGYLGSRDDRFYLQPKVLDLGYAFISSFQIDKLIQPFLNELSARTSEASTFAILDNNKALFVARAAGPKILQTAVGVGGSVPAYSTSLGHALLSGLTPAEVERYIRIIQRDAGYTADLSATLRASVDKTRSQGWALVTDLLAEGIAAIAAPVKRRDGSIIGAVNVAKYGTTNAKTIKQHLPLLLETIKRIERALDSSDQGTLLAGVSLV